MDPSAQQLQKDGEYPSPTISDVQCLIVDIVNVHPGEQGDLTTSVTPIPSAGSQGTSSPWCVDRDDIREDSREPGEL